MFISLIFSCYDHELYMSFCITKNPICNNYVYIFIIILFTIRWMFYLWRLKYVATHKIKPNRHCN